MRTRRAASIHPRTCAATFSGTGVREMPPSMRSRASARIPCSAARSTDARVMRKSAPTPLPVRSAKRASSASAAGAGARKITSKSGCTTTSAGVSRSSSASVPPRR